MATASKLLATQTGGDKLYVDDVFNIWLRTGTGASTTVTTGVDMTDGGFTITKARSTTTGWRYVDTERGATKSIESSSTSAETTESTGLTSFNVDGVTFGSDADYNASGQTFVDYHLRKAPKFFDIVTYTGDGTTNRVISHSLRQEVGMIQTKSTSTTGDWNTYHKSATGDLKLNLTDSQTASKTIISSSTSTTFTVNGVANTNGVTYVAYLFAHDTEEDGMIQCGSYTGNGSTAGNKVTLGWEPQYLLVKNASAAANWIQFDTMRGIARAGGARELRPNTSDAEANADASWELDADGFRVVNTNAINCNRSGDTYIYMAIRRPNKPPESGSEVFAIGTRTASSPAFESGFPVDMALYRDVSLATDTWCIPRLTANNGMRTNLTLAEISGSRFYFDYMNGWYDQLSALTTEYSWMFRRAPSFFDVVCYTGDGVAGRTVNHNLGVAPELMWVKQRNDATFWRCYSSTLGATKNLKLHLTDAEETLSIVWNDTEPTDSVFSVGSLSNTNGSTQPYIAYLFATLEGISKVGSYTGNGTSQTINCGFSTGARFILIKRTDSTGDWCLWDSLRGIVAVNDPHLSLNTAAAEVTTDDSVDPESTGFIVNQVAATNINVNAASYIFLAIA